MPFLSPSGFQRLTVAPGLWQTARCFVGPSTPAALLDKAAPPRRASCAVCGGLLQRRTAPSLAGTAAACKPCRRPRLWMRLPSRGQVGGLPRLCVLAEDVGQAGRGAVREDAGSVSNVRGGRRGRAGGRGQAADEGDQGAGQRQPGRHGRVHVQLADPFLGPHDGRAPRRHPPLPPLRVLGLLHSKLSLLLRAPSPSHVCLAVDAAWLGMCCLLRCSSAAHPAPRSNWRRTDCST